LSFCQQNLAGDFWLEGGIGDGRSDKLFARLIKIAHQEIRFDARQRRQPPVAQSYPKSAGAFCFGCSMPSSSRSIRWQKSY
jgi:hypothetical protein